jgi:hypothetical protein
MRHPTIVNNTSTSTYRNGSSSNGNNENVKGSKNQNGDDDDDLKSLIENKQQQKQRHNISANTPSSHEFSYVSTITGLLRYQLHTCCFFYPVTCTIVFVLLVGICFWLLIGAIINPYEQFGIADGHDHSDIRSKYDFKIQEVDHFCLGGGGGGGKSGISDESCTCENPLDPYARAEYSSWVLAYKMNRRKIDQQYIEKKKNPDVAFLGGSIGTFFSFLCIVFPH